jgi:GNAT superfamily N-acetyltransferase
MFRSARGDECETLSDLAFRSKASWGYSADFMAKCRSELTLDAHYLAENEVEVLELETEIIGFYSIEEVEPELAELGHLFVRPDLLRQGHGRPLFERACQKARALGFRRLRVHGDPNAAEFYQTLGARFVGMAPSATIPGRELPVFEIELGSVDR